MGKIRPEELDERLSADDVFVLDVRPRTTYQSGSIDGSYNAPVYDDLRAGDTDALDQYLERVPSDADVVTVCKMGVVAKRATSHLQENGYEATTLAGGMRGWRHYENETLLYRLTSLLRRLRP